MRRQKKERAVFLDRDGVINEIIFHQEIGIIETPFTVKQFRLKRHVPNALLRLKRLGFKTVVVSNQPGVAMRHFTRKTLAAITEKMVGDLRKSGASLDGVFYCLHHPTKGVGRLKRHCGCRKPKAGLLFQAKRQLHIDLEKSYLIGDSVSDIQAGLRAGCTTILLAHLKCDLCHLMARRGIKPHYIVQDLREAAQQIYKIEGRR